MMGSTTNTTNVKPSGADVTGMFRIKSPPGIPFKRMLEENAPEPDTPLIIYAPSQQDGAATDPSLEDLFSLCVQYDSERVIEQIFRPYKFAILADDAQEAVDMLEFFLNQDKEGFYTKALRSVHLYVQAHEGQIVHDEVLDDLKDDFGKAIKQIPKLLSHAQACNVRIRGWCKITPYCNSPVPGDHSLFLDCDMDTFEDTWHILDEHLRKHAEPLYVLQNENILAGVLSGKVNTMVLQ